MLVSGALAFDVHAAREASLALVALEDEQAVFEDWCRERGMGPENRSRRAFSPDQWAYGWTRGEDDALTKRGFTRSDAVVSFDDASYAYPYVRPSRGGWPGKLAREWPGDRRAPMGRTLAKLGRAVLRALEGQPSECQNPKCEAGQRTYSVGGPVECSICHGTGHNLRGCLPEVEPSPQLRRRMTEGEGGFFDDTMAAWLTRLQGDQDYGCALELLGPRGVDDRTRVTSRGEHRHRRVIHDGSAADVRISSRVLDPHSQLPDERWRLPRWRRGELRHAQQRQERRRRAPGQTLTYVLDGQTEETWDNSPLAGIVDSTHAPAPRPPD